MTWQTLHNLQVWIQHFVSFIGVFIIVLGVIRALYFYLRYQFRGELGSENAYINIIRLDLGRVLILGLEFIVAADLIGTTTTPDYYSVGLLAIIVLIRTLLSYSINKEITSITKNESA